VKSAKQKIYCYVDETGQDTKGSLFLVAVVVSQQGDKEKLEQTLIEIEKQSRKRMRKWQKTRRERKISYITKLIESNALRRNVFYSHYKQTKEYFDLTIATTAKAILQKARQPYIVRIWVDGLKKSERFIFKAGLRKFAISVDKVQGVKNEQNNALILLADAMAGFMRDCLEGDKEMRELYQRMVEKKVMNKV
jgi:hypothetical protein